MIFINFHQDKLRTLKKRQQENKKEHTTVGIRWWSPTQLLVYRSEACVWQSGRDAQFSSVYGRMYYEFKDIQIYNIEYNFDGTVYLNLLSL